MLTQRLGSRTQKNPVFIDSILSIIKANPGCCDEVWLASDYGYPKISGHQYSAEVLKEVAKKFKEAGIRISLQISNTIGHGEYMKAQDCTGVVYEGSPMEHMVGHDGTIAGYCFCWRGKHFKEYLLEEIRIYADKLKPHRIWLDDDFRPHNHAPVNYGCFCDDCIEAFNRQFHSQFTRESLVFEINYGDPVWRERHVQFLREGIGSLAYEISKTVHEVSPHTGMAYQHGFNGGYIGYGDDFIHEAMKSATGIDTADRPGAGCYDAHNPNDIIEKKFILDYQMFMLPEYVTEIRPEIENLPDVIYGKSVSSTCLESSVYFASGANAMSYAMIMSDNERMEWHNEMFQAFAQHRPYWEALAEVSSRSKLAGLQVYFSKDMWKKSPNETLFSYNNESIAEAKGMARTGIPITYDSVKDPVYLLPEANARLLSQADIEYLLTQNVLMDGAAAQVILEAGYESDLGIRVVPKTEARLFVKLLKHSVNGAFYAERVAGGSFLKGRGYVITNKGGEIEAFATLDTEAKDIPKTESEYPYGMAGVVVRTQKGGNWVVFGRNIWDEVTSYDHRNQIIYAADYISGGKVPAILENGLQSVVMPRENAEGKVVSVSILNCEIGESKELTLRVRKPAGNNITWMKGTEKEVILSYEQDGEDLIIKVPSLSGWSMGTVFIRE